MLISIIIALSYSLINLMGKQLSLFEKENTQILEYNLFNSTLINDTNNSTKFTFDNEHLKLEFYDNSSIGYRIKNNIILRDMANKTDTFKINVVSHSFKQKSENKYSKDFLHLQLVLLKDTINVNYRLKSNTAESINKQLFNED